MRELIAIFLLAALAGLGLFSAYCGYDKNAYKTPACFIPPPKEK